MIQCVSLEAVPPFFLHFIQWKPEKQYRFDFKDKINIINIIMVMKTKDFLKRSSFPKHMWTVPDRFVFFLIKAQVLLNLAVVLPFFVETEFHQSQCI